MRLSGNFWNQIDLVQCVKIIFDNLEMLKVKQGLAFEIFECMHCAKKEVFH